MNTPSFPSLSFLVAAGYLVTNVFCLMAYWPQLKSIFSDRVARSKIVPATWWIWAMGGATECLYAATGAHQWLWAIVAAVHMLACSAVAATGSLHGWMARRAMASVPTSSDNVLPFRRNAAASGTDCGEAAVQTRVPA